MSSNVPAPIHQVDPDSLVRVLAEQQAKQQRNVNDPNVWIYVNNEGPNGDQPWAPPWQNGFFNVGPPRCLLRYRFLRPYDPDTTQSAVQLQGSVAGGATSATIFTIKRPLWAPGDDLDTPSGLAAVTFDSNIYLTCTDDSADLKIITIQEDGDVVYGFV